MNLDPSQLAAVRSRAPRTLVEGGPGTGKTEVCARWAAGLIAEGADPAEVLILTADLRAAHAMRQRTLELLADLPQPKAPPTVETFLTLAAALLREDPAAHGLQPGFTIQSDFASEQVWELIVMHTHPDERGWTTRRLKATVSNAVNRGLDPEARLRETEGAKAQAAVEAYREYETAKRERNCLDPCDVLKVWAERLAADPAGTEQLRARFPNVAVDDFQNCVPRHAELLNRWNPARRFVTGDEDQAIGLRFGSRPDMLGRLKARLPGARTLTLEHNHRSGQAILDLANAVLDPARPPTRPWTVAPEVRPATLNFYKWPTPEAETEAAFQWAAARLREKQTVCVLARSPFDLEKLTDLLKLHGTPCENLDPDFVEKSADPAPASLPPMPPDRPGRVTVGSIHAAKGREWDCVWIMGMGDRQSPDPKTKSPLALEEERRLVYVAVTRAKQFVLCSCPVNLPRRQPQEPCRFLPLERIRWDESALSD